MLLKLTIQDYAFFEDFEITLSEGLNVVTGESGSGKSLFVKALMTLMGKPQDIIKMNENLLIQGYLIIGESIQGFLKNVGIDASDELVITAKLQNRRLIYRINGIMVPRDLLQRLSKEIFVFHTQGFESKLLTDKFYINLLDKFVDEKLLANYKESFKIYSELLEKKKRFGDNISDILKRKDFLRFQVNEIETFSPNSIEEKELSEKYSMMMDSQNIRNSIAESLKKIRTGENSVYDLLNDVKYSINNLNKDFLKKLAEKIDILIDLLEEWRIEAEHIFEEAEYDPKEFERITNRLNGYQLLKRKYGSSVEKILENLDKMKKELKELENIENEMSQIDEKLRTLEQNLKGLVSRISEERRKNAIILEELVKKHLFDLKMRGVKVRFEFKKLDRLSINGIDKVKLVASINPGTPEKSIGKIASGGELSRIMLAIELAISEKIGNLSLVFDEVDSGIGQRTAEILAKKLRSISKKHQVIIISHLPQIPLVADKHFLVLKNSMQNETKMIVKELSKKERIEEIANMFGESFKSVKNKIEEIIS